MFICSKCSSTTPKWTGKCPTCGEWNSLIESNIQKPKSKIIGSKAIETTKIESSSHAKWIERFMSMSTELDNVLGGWLSLWSLVLLSWEPWIGKSTLALQMAEWYSSHHKWDAVSGQWVTKVLYVSWEEHVAQISARARRLGVTSDMIDLVTESEFDSIINTIERSDAQIVIIDSLSVLSSSSIEWSPGSVSQIRVMTEMCMNIAKKMRKSIILIGHVTKDGSIGGPKSLEHLVDVVLFLEWVRTENYRILRALKNRFGPDRKSVV